jgi:hypothetical protein
MSVILRMIDDLREPIQLVALTALLCWIGGYMLAGRDDLRAWGYRLAGFSFCAYNVYGIWNFEPDSADQFLGIVIRALIAAFLARGFFSIVLAVLGFIYRTMVARALERARRRAEQLAYEVERLARERALSQRQAMELSLRRAADHSAPPPKPKTLREKIAAERGVFDERREALKELEAVADFDNELLHELSKNELERYVRRVTDALGYDE